MLTHTSVSHILTLLAVCACAVTYALTDEDLEKILTDAASSEDSKPMRRYPDIEELDELKDRLEALESLDNSAENAVFGPVNPGAGARPDGIFDELLGDRNERTNDDLPSGRGRQYMPLTFADVDPVHQALAEDLEGLQGVPNQLSQLNEDGTGRDSSGISRDNGVNSSTFLEMLANCLKQRACKRRFAANAGGAKVQQQRNGDMIKTLLKRNPFCNRGGCRGKRLSEGIRRFLDDVREKARKRNALCNRQGCFTRS